MNNDTVSLPRRSLGRLPHEVTPIGLGTYHLTSDRGVDHVDAVNLVIAAMAHGVNVVDTAPLYGLGEAEQIVGEAFEKANRPEDVLLIDKIGRFEKSILARLGDQAYASPKLMLKQLEHSLRIMGVNRVPLLLIHETDWEEWGLPADPERIDEAPLWEFVNEAKSRGLIGGVGLSVRKPARAAELCLSGRFDAMLFVHYHNMIWQSSAAEALRVAVAQDMGVLIGAPYRQGLLTSDDPYLPRRLEEEKRSSVPPGIIRRIGEAQRIARDNNMGMIEMGLRWLLADQRVHTTLVGPRSVPEMLENIDWCRRGPLEADVVSALASLQEIEEGAW